MYAIKLIDKNFIVENGKQGIIINERNAMTQLDHPYLVKLDWSFESRNYIVFVMEYCSGGEMFYQLKKIRRMSEEQAKFYFIQICLGI